MGKFISVLTTVLLFMPAILLAGNSNKLHYKLTVGAGLLQGDTTYQIGGYTEYSDSTSDTIHFPLSELKFPLDSTMFSINSTFEFSDRITGSVGIKKNIADSKGKLKDSDWGVWHIGGELPHNSSTCDPSLCTADSLDIYSESDSTLDAFIFDINVRYIFNTYKVSNVSLDMFGGLGYKYENFDYEVSNLDQWYPSFEGYFGFDYGHDYDSREVLTYDVTYHITYIEAGASAKLSNRININTSIGFSPIVFVRDRDYHILRDKVSKGKLDGQAVMFSLNMEYKIRDNWFSTINFSYTNIETSGEQKQYFSDVLYATIDEKVTSHQTSAFLNIGYSFN